jgi:branched-chain amino acid transport system ATP-binding protein
MVSSVETVESLLEVRSVAKSYGALHVLTEIDFAVPTGQAVGIVGPNGAGKSTLLSVIHGTDRASSGSVRFDGHDVTKQGPEVRARAGIGRTFQIPRPFTNMTVFENALSGASYGAGLHGRAADEQALHALELSGMMALANTPAGKLPPLARNWRELWPRTLDSYCSTKSPAASRRPSATASSRRSARCTHPG